VFFRGFQKAIENRPVSLVAVRREPLTGGPLVVVEKLFKRDIRRVELELLAVYFELYFGKFGFSGFLIPGAQALANSLVANSKIARLDTVLSFINRGQNRPPKFM